MIDVSAALGDVTEIYIHTNQRKIRNLWVQYLV